METFGLQLRDIAGVYSYNSISRRDAPKDVNIWRRTAKFFYDSPVDLQGDDGFPITRIMAKIVWKFKGGPGIVIGLVGQHADRVE